MEAMKLKTVFLCLVVMGSMPSPGYAQSLQEAIEESLIVPLATLEADAEAQINLAPLTSIWPEYQTAKAKVRQGKKRARHCRATLKPVDDHLEIVEIVECVQTMEAIADMCGATTEQFRLNENLRASIDTEMETLKKYATQCVTENITGFSALMIYEVKREAKDQYAGLIEKCRQEETNTLGVLGYQFIWPCFKGYLDMIDEPLEPAPTEIPPEPTEDSEILPKVKA